MLTNEYLGGRRARFLPPLRLYLVCSVLYFLASATLPESPASNGKTSFSYAGDSGIIRIGAGDRGGAAIAPAGSVVRARRDTLEQSRTADSSRRAALVSLGHPVPAGPLDSAAIVLADSVLIEQGLARELGPNPGRLRRAFLTRFVHNGERASRDKRGFNRQIREQIPRLMFVLMPAFAALLALAYRSRRRRYATHLVVSLHIHTFAFAVLTVGAFISALPASRPRSAGLGLVALWMFAYVPLALRRVYGGRLWSAVARAAVLEAMYGVLAIVVVAVGAVLLVAFY